MNLASTEEERSPPLTAPRRQPRTTRGVARRPAVPNPRSGAAPNRRNRLAASAVMSVVDLCSPMGPPNDVPAARGRARGAGRRRGRGGRAVNYSSDEAETINLDNTIEGADFDEAGPSSYNSDSVQPSTSSHDVSTDSSKPHCPICLCQWTSPVSTLCGHIFCKNCIAQWVKVTKTCPVCKAGAAKLKTHPIFIS